MRSLRRDAARKLRPIQLARQVPPCARLDGGQIPGWERIWGSPAFPLSGIGLYPDRLSVYAAQFASFSLTTTASYLRFITSGKWPCCCRGDSHIPETPGRPPSKTPNFGPAPIEPTTPSNAKRRLHFWTSPQRPGAPCFSSGTNFAEMGISCRDAGGNG